MGFDHETRRRSGPARGLHVPFPVFRMGLWHEGALVGCVWCRGFEVLAVCTVVVGDTSWALAIGGIQGGEGRRPGSRRGLVPVWGPGRTV